MELNKIYNQDCLTGMQQLSDQSVHCCVTSPPYWGLRDYGVDGQHGLEETPEAFIARQIEVFREVRRVLRDDGTLWVNIGDSYANNARKRTVDQVIGGTITGKDHHIACKDQINKVTGDLKRKDLVGIPWMLAFALRADGWYLRQDIIWSKPNPMPESCNDRCTKSHEYIFLLSKHETYYYNAAAIATAYKDKTYTTYKADRKGNGDGSGLVSAENWARDVKIRKPKQWKMPDGWDTSEGTHGNIHRAGRQRGHKRPHQGFNSDWDQRTKEEQQFEGANKRSVWTMATKPFKEAHFATFPEELPYTCILAGCPENGVVLDPYMGAGTTALVARKTNRNFIGFELNPEYLAIAENRLQKELGMFK